MDVNEFLSQLDNIKSFNGKIKYADQNLERIGSGSGRIVYSVDDSKALKLAKNAKGIAQNEVEAGIGGDYTAKHIVTDVFDSADNNSWVLAEKAKKVTEKRIKELTGIPSLWDLQKFLQNQVDSNRGRNVYKQDQELVDFFWENEFASDLITFVVDYGQISGDMGRPSTYGEVIKDGQPAIVLTDYGLNDEVYDTYYRKKSRYNLYELHLAGVNYGDHLADIGNVSQEVRHGMWAFVPAGVGDGDEINEEFVNFVMDRSVYPKQATNRLPQLADIFHSNLNNLGVIIKSVEDPTLFVKNLIALQNYLISHNYYDRQPISINDKPELNEELIKEGIERNTADQIAKKFIQKKGYNKLEFIGSGEFGAAYDIGNNKVLKITSDYTEANDNINIKNKNLRHIAVPYDVFKLNWENYKHYDNGIKMQKDLYLIILEKLKTDPITFEKHIKILDNFFVKNFKIHYNDVIGDYVHYGWNKEYDKNKFRKFIINNPETAKFFEDILKIADEVKQHDVDSMDFVSSSNLGYKEDGTLAFFDLGFGNYLRPLSQEIQSIDVNENFAGGGTKFTTDGNVSSDGFPTYDNTADTSPSISNNLDANSAMYNEDLEYNHVDDATQDEFILTEFENQVFENIQKMDKEYVKTGHFTEKDKENVLSITNGDNYTFDIAKIYDVCMGISNPRMDRFDDSNFKDYYERELNSYYNELRNYNKNVFPIKNKDNLHSIDLVTALKARKNIIHFLKQLPSIYLRNLKNDIRTERTPMELEYGELLKEIIPNMKRQLKNIQRLSDDKKNKILNKIFSKNNNTFEKVNDQLQKLDVLFLSHDDSVDDIRSKIDYSDGEASILYDDDNILVVDVKSSDAMKSLGCGSQWCFSTEYDDKYWDEYSNNKNVNIVYNFKKNPESRKRMVVVLERNYDYEVYDMYNDQMADGEGYLGSLGVIKYINAGQTANSAEYVEDLNEEYDDYLDKIENLLHEINEGVGDKYLDRKYPHVFKNDEFGVDFEEKFLNHTVGDINFTALKSPAIIIRKGVSYKHGVYVNPSTLRKFQNNVRGIVLESGNYYICANETVLHQEIAIALKKNGLITIETPQEIYDKPNEIIPVIRRGMSDTIELSASYEGSDLETVKRIFDKASSKSGGGVNFRAVVSKTDKGINENNLVNEKNSNIFAEINENISVLQQLPFVSEIKELGGKIYSVGGAVRDEFLGKQSKDLDVLITGVPLDELGQILTKYGTVKLVGESFGVYKFIPEGSNEEIDIAIPRTETPTGGGGHKDFDIKSDHKLPIEKDLYRRDFTINAIAKDINGKIIDPYNGQEDLKNKIIRAVNPDAFSDDPLRMLRAVQFASRFGFTIEPHTLEMIQKNLDSVGNIAFERRFIELEKIQQKGDMRYGAQLLKDTGLFRKLFGYELNQSIIDDAPFNKVKTTGEFIFLLLQESQTPEVLFKTRIHNLNDEYKEIKALNIGYKTNINNIVAARSIAHNMYLTYPKSLESDILPNLIKTACNDLLHGKYPKIVEELAINGNDLMELGLQGKTIGDMKKKLLLAVYADKIINNKEDLINMVKNTKNNIKEEINPETIENAKKNIPIQYTGIVIDDLRKDRLLQLFDKYIPDDWKIINENMHVTIKLGALDDIDPMKYHLNFPIHVNATHIGISDKAIALKVNIETDKIKSKNDIPHITLAYNKNDGAKPKDSNYITDWQELKRPIKIRGIFQEVPYTFNV